MSVAEPRYCARSKRCVWYVREGKPGKLSSKNPSLICEQCREEEAKALREYKATIEWGRVDFDKNRREGRLRVLKQDLVAEMLGAPGDVREAVKEVRAWWRISDPPEALPPESDDVLVPRVLKGGAKLSELCVASSAHPHLPPIAWALSRHSSEPRAWPTDRQTMYLNLKRRWLGDLFWVLLHGVPEEYMEPLGEQAARQVGSPPVPAHRLPWLRFASALVLYDVPPERAESFADYGGLLSGLSEAEEPTLDVLTERQLREEEIAADLREAFGEMLAKRVCELLHEAAGELDYEQAQQEVLRRFGAELEQELDQLRRGREQEMELEERYDPGLHRRRYVRFDPLEDTDEDVVRALRAARKEAGYEPPSAGAPSQGRLPAVRTAVLLERGYAKRELMESMDRSESTVNALERDGRKLLEAGRSQLED